MIDELNRIENLWGIKFEDTKESSILTIASFVASDSLAERAGLEIGDKLLKIDNQTFPSKRDIVIALAAKGPKSKFSLTVLRHG